MLDLVLFVGTALLSFLLTGAVLRFSLKRDLLDHPNVRSSHTTPRPRLGGIAITIAFYTGCAVMLMAGMKSAIPAVPLAGMLAGGALIAVGGLADDLRGLDARLKLLIQLGAAGIAVASGNVMNGFTLPFAGTIEFGVFAAPLTVLWIAAIVNFYNFIDGIDGLAAGIGLIASSFLFFISGLAGAPDLRGFYVLLAGSSFGFLRFNFPPARIFMGDTGSTFIGYSFAVLAVAGERLGIPAFLTVLLLASAIGDAVLTLVRRALKGERLLSPHRTHYYQRLTSLGLSHKQVTLIEYFVTVLLGVSAILAFHREEAFVTFLSVMWIGFFLWALAKIRSMERGRRLFWEGRTIGIAFGDLAFIALSYVLGFWLRLNFRFPEAETGALLRSLPIVLVIRTAVFFWYGVYRGVWRYTTFDDLLRIVKAVSAGSAIMVVSFTLLFRFEAFPRSVFLIDWFVLTVFMAGSRIAVRWFHELPPREDIAGRRVAIAGAGPEAELILAGVRRAGGFVPVGYLDDRTEMRGRDIHGLRVLGALAEAPRVARRHRIAEILAPGAFADRVPPEARSALERDGVRLRVIVDPASLSLELAEGEPACAGKRVLAAGNGPLVEAAPAVFAPASRLTLVSNDPRTLEGGQGPGGDACGRIERYLGVADDRDALRGIVDRHGPEIVFADFTTRGAPVANPAEAYVRTVLAPLEKLAFEAARSGRPVFVALLREPAAGPPGAALAASAVLRDAFRRDPGRLVVAFVDREPRGAAWRGIARELEGTGGGLYRLVRGEAGEEAFSLRREGDAAPVPEIGPLWLDIARSLDSGDRAALEGALRAIAFSVKEHAS